MSGGINKVWCIVSENGHAIQPAENAAQLATRISMSNHKNLDMQVADQLRDTIRQMQKDFDRLGTRVKRLEETSGQKQQVIGTYIKFTNLKAYCKALSVSFGFGESRSRVILSKILSLKILF
jgi:hypothetical protein